MKTNSHKRSKTRRVKKTVHRVEIQQGLCHVTADTRRNAEEQARTLEHHLKMRVPGVNNQTEVEPGVYALGVAAKKQLGVRVHE